MADISLSTFKSQVSDVARPNRFWCEIVGGTVASQWKNEPFAFLVKSAGLPARTIGEIELNWQGMKAKLAGDPTFDTFSMTFRNDYGMELKKFFDDWMEEIANMNSNDRSDQLTYKAEVKISQLGRTADQFLKTYKLIGAWPSSVDQVELSSDSTDTESELNVTFTYDYFEIE